MAQDYNTTLNLPQTDFSMRGNLPQKEPGMIEDWDNSRMYYKMIEKNQGKPRYVLHDGPPYANGDIHLGTALNKVLKDIIVKQKNMSGYCSPYIPGWDTHGLPIELKVLKQMGVENGAVPAPELRKHCAEYAHTQVKNQMNQFKRLGVQGDFDDPYLTLKPEFEAREVEIFGEMYKKGYIYKGLKPVYWCPDCQTALAEAEIEYANDPCHSIYVKFKVTDDKGKFTAMGLDLDKTYFVIWTTTTWTLPGNLAICVGPEYEYTVVKADGENYIMAAELVPAAMKARGVENYTTEGSFKGSELEYMKTAHPFMNRESLVIVGDHVTLESGTGCVHTAPGHGVDDFNVCQNYPEIPTICPVDSNGVLTEEAGQFAGLTTDEANKKIAVYLDENGYLFALKKIIHQYPHCWRCKTPILFRATDQWFCSVEDFKDKACEAIDSVKWIPAWGHDRITNMVKERKDWCISRQRKWGVPIPIFFCKECGEAHIDNDAMMAVADLFEKEGSNAWYSHTAAEILPEGTKCKKCGCTEFEKEKDIMDVWFDSGSSHAAVVSKRDNLKFPADLYLEGNDQYRGWFQSSLLTSVATEGVAPYKAVLTHGMILDEEKRKMSKSLGNGISPQDVTEKYGADVLRLWVSSTDYQSDVHISNEILKQISESYRKIRNTARYILGNVYDFNPDTDSVPVNELMPMDKWAIVKLNELIAKVKQAYDNYEFHQVYHSIRNFCVIDMSNFYLDVLKDRLYTEKSDSKSRKAAQTAIYIILNAMTRMISPILAYTSDEIWKYMPHSSNENAENVIFNEMPNQVEIETDADFMSFWDEIHQLRDDVKKSLEGLIKDKTIKSSLEAKVTLKASGEKLEFLKKAEPELAAAFIVSAVEIAENNGELEIAVDKAIGEKCERCWIISETVGTDSEHPHLCKRCCSILK